ncbi:MAG: hypothetical protein ABI597_10970 [Gammaproteobacteria bacterium]
MKDRPSTEKSLKLGEVVQPKRLANCGFFAYENYRYGRHYECIESDMIQHCVEDFQTYITTCSNPESITYQIVNKKLNEVVKYTSYTYLSEQIRDLKVVVEVIAEAIRKHENSREMTIQLNKLHENLSIELIAKKDASKQKMLLASFCDQVLEKINGVLENKLPPPEPAKPAQKAWTTEDRMRFSEERRKFIEERTRKTFSARLSNNCFSAFRYSAAMAIMPHVLPKRVSFPLSVVASAGLSYYETESAYVAASAFIFQVLPLNTRLKLALAISFIILEVNTNTKNKDIEVTLVEHLFLWLASLFVGLATHSTVNYAANRIKEFFGQTSSSQVEAAVADIENAASVRKRM